MDVYRLFSSSRLLLLSKALFVCDDELTPEEGADGACKGGEGGVEAIRMVIVNCYRAMYRTRDVISEKCGRRFSSGFEL